MAFFPELSTIKIEQLDMEDTFNNIESKFGDTGVRKVRRKSLFQKRNVKLKYSDVTQAEIRTLKQFYLDRYGSYESFYFGTALSDVYEGEYVQTGDGSTLAFNLPSVNASSRQLYVDNVVWQETTDWVFTALGGTDGVDLCTMIAPVNDGLHITYDFSGELIIRCHFNKDKVSYSYFHNVWADIKFGIEGELYE